MDIPFKKTGYPLYSSEALIGSLHFLEVDKHGQQQGKIKTGLTQRRGERRGNSQEKMFSAYAAPLRGEKQSCSVYSHSMVDGGLELMS